MAAKKEVDRKATKGRKIKYVVHEKLKGFMVPDENTSLLENSEELLKRLFGKKDPASSKVQKVVKSDVRLI